MQFCCCNLSPRGDGNVVVRGAVWSNGILLQFIPARGRKPSHQPSRPSPYRLQFIPARGRKHFSHSFTSKDSRCNLSPRGDGNLRSLKTGNKLRQLQFIPARGRKLQKQLAELVQLGCNLSPRGDGNRNGDNLHFVALRCNLSPRGDGNREKRGAGKISLRVAIYPREGTETKPEPDTMP